MAGLDQVTEFRAMGVPVGGGAVLAAGMAVADAAGAVANKLAGSQIGAAAPAIGQILAAWLFRQRIVSQFVGDSTADVLSMVSAAAAIDSLVGVRALTRQVLTSVGVPTLSAGPRAASLGQTRVSTMPQVFRSEVQRKATLTRL